MADKAKRAALIGYDCLIPKRLEAMLAQGGLDALSDKARVRFARDENLRKLPVVQELARAHGVTVGAIALGFLTGHDLHRSLSPHARRGGLLLLP